MNNNIIETSHNKPTLIEAFVTYVQESYEGIPQDQFSDIIEPFCEDDQLCRSLIMAINSKPEKSLNASSLAMLTIIANNTNGANILQEYIPSSNENDIPTIE
ncbi:MAG TPA: hypothetical protein DEP72_07615 [Clostridiales bacterium]|nr:MAG: hypothetical protein A2Y18_07020 [Clostridiales bacterium GWD2_32_19]HCC08003.1 hypothetical protein [Clostridiales bacterium]